MSKNFISELPLLELKDEGIFLNGKPWKNLVDLQIDLGVDKMSTVTATFYVHIQGVDSHQDEVFKVNRGLNEED